MEILSRIWIAVEIPGGVHLIVEIIGWGVLAFCFVVGMYLFIKEPIEVRRAKKLAAEVLTNPTKAYQQIINLENAIDQEEKKHTRIQQGAKATLKYNIEAFDKRFPYTNIEAFRKHIEEKSSANR